MKRKDFLKYVREKAKTEGLDFFVDEKKGKGSHYRVKVGNRKTTVPKRITPTLAKIILKQLGLK